MEEPQRYSLHEDINIEKQDAVVARKKLYILRVEYPNGRVVENKNVLETLIDVISYAGIERVRGLGIIINNVNLVSSSRIPKYKNSQKSVGNGMYVMTCCDTNKKKKIIEHISDALNLYLKVRKVHI
jgi:hypothetical protein